MAKPKRLGHPVLRVRDVDASAKFYSDILGPEVTTSITGRMVFMKASGE